MIACTWCGASFTPGRRDARFCSKKCRQTAFRLRKRRVADAGQLAGGTFCYADPPYPGLAARFYKHEASYAGEVDHRLLIAWLEELRASGALHGWALSTSNRALRSLLPLCPDVVRVCWWGKPIGVPAATYGIHATSEAVLVVGGRQLRPGVRDWLSAQPARGGGKLPGRKPIAFCAWLFDLLGMQPGDAMLDLFPGTGIVGRAWRELNERGRQQDLSLAAPGDPSFLEERREPGDASPVDERRSGVRWQGVAGVLRDGEPPERETEGGAV